MCVCVCEYLKKSSLTQTTFSLSLALSLSLSLSLLSNAHLKEVTDSKINKKRRRAILATPLPDPPPALTQGVTPSVTQGVIEKKSSIGSSSEGGKEERGGGGGGVGRHVIKRSGDTKPIQGKYIFTSCDDVDAYVDDDADDDVEEGEGEGERESGLDMSLSCDQVGEGYLMGGEEVFQVREGEGERERK